MCRGRYAGWSYEGAGWSYAGAGWSHEGAGWSYADVSCAKVPDNLGLLSIVGFSRLNRVPWKMCDETSMLGIMP